MFSLQPSCRDLPRSRPQAPCEAEAQCAELAKAGKVFATATEDMDALTFGSTVLLRHMTFSEARKMPIQEFYLDKVLEQLELTMDQVWVGRGHGRGNGQTVWARDKALCGSPHASAFLRVSPPFQFIDLCIMLGCDYCETIRGTSDRGGPF